MITTPNPEKENGMAQKTKKWQEIKVVSIFLKHPVRVDISRWFVILLTTRWSYTIHIYVERIVGFSPHSEHAPLLVWKCFLAFPFVLRNPMGCIMMLFLPVGPIILMDRNTDRQTDRSTTLYIREIHYILMTVSDFCKKWICFLHRKYQKTRTSAVMTVNLFSREWSASILQEDSP